MTRKELSELVRECILEIYDGKELSPIDKKIIDRYKIEIGPSLSKLNEMYTDIEETLNFTLKTLKDPNTSDEQWDKEYNLLELLKNDLLKPMLDSGYRTEQVSKLIDDIENTLEGN